MRNMKVAILVSCSSVKKKKKLGLYVRMKNRNNILYRKFLLCHGKPSYIVTSVNTPYAAGIHAV